MRYVMCVLTLALLGCDAANGSTSRTLILVHTDPLTDAADAWADYRRSTGWSVVQLPVEDADDPAELRKRIRETAKKHDTNGLAVLLLGDADPQGDGLPTWRFAQTDESLRDRDDSSYATDQPYQYLDDGDDVPDVALGRVPARDNATALVVLDKIRRYEKADNLGSWRRHVTYAAGEGHYGFADQILEGLFKVMVTEFVPADYDMTLSYAKPTSEYCPPPSRLTETVLGQLGDGALLFNYVGHGLSTRFDALWWNGRAYSILTVRDLDRLGPADHARLPIALLTCCSAGWYDLPGGRLSIGEAMLFHPAGPVAVVAGSRITHPYANAVLQKEFSYTLLVERVATVGALDLEAAHAMLVVDESDLQMDTLALPVSLFQRWPSSLAELRRTHIELYNLLGDPCTRIPAPDRDGLELVSSGDRITGRVDGMTRGRVTITFETDRVAPAQPSALRPMNGPNDPDLEAKATHNYPLANERVLLRLETIVADGRFDVALDDGIPETAAFVKAYAWGERASGDPLDAIVAVRLSRLASRTADPSKAVRGRDPNPE